MFSGIVSRLLRRRLRSSPSRQETLDEAESQYLAKRAKLETAADGVFVNSLREIDQDERERVAAYMEDKVPAFRGLARGRKGKKMASDFIVCDDYRKGTGAVPTMVMGAVATAALALAGFMLWSSGDKQEPPAAVDTDTQYEARLKVE